MKTLKSWQFWLGVVISLVFLYYALRGLGLQDLGRALLQADYIWLLPGVAVYFIGVWARAWRWHYLLRPVKSISTRAMFPIVAIGYMGNNIFPIRAGEVLRALVLKKNEDVPVSASLATIIVERVFDGVVMLAFVFVNLPELARLTADSGFVGDIRTLALVGTGVFIGALAAFLLAAMFPARAEKVAEGLICRLLPTAFTPPDLLGMLKSGSDQIIRVFAPRSASALEAQRALASEPSGQRDPLNLQERALGLSERFLGGLTALRSPRDALMVFLTSVVIWLLETGKYWFVMHAFPFEVSFFALMLMNGIVNLATTIPSAPGYVGTFDAPGIAVLGAYGVEKAVAAAYTLVLHVALWLPITALGAYYFLREGLKWEFAGAGSSADYDGA
ncbi:MAG: flippase-like domain-containing protein [Anaerolineales bacterium]|nr:flippase-like domain-containing protein [Anaerolineales bacterium]